MTIKWTQWLVLAGFVVAFGAGIVACDNFFFLRGTLHGDCDAPRAGSTTTTQTQQSNCQPSGAICCRTNPQAPRTSCEYPENCYIAPYLGVCATPVDCVSTQTCKEGTCQCTLGGSDCLNPNTNTRTCCTADQLCDPVMFVCTVPDGGIVTVVDMAGAATGPDLRSGTASTDLSP